MKEDRITLFCLPFAGGNRYSYRNFEGISERFVFNTIEYPGRGNRIKEPLLLNVIQIVDDLYKQIESMFEQANYAIFGHSLGGLLGFLLAQKIVENKRPLPVHLFISGSRAPSARSNDTKPRSILEKEEFKQEIKRLNGMPDDILKDDVLFDFFEPILRADFCASENFAYQRFGSLPIPFTVFNGADDDFFEEDINLWQQESDFSVQFIEMSGTHFFIYKHTKKIIEIMESHVLNKALFHA